MINESLVETALAYVFLFEFLLWIGMAIFYGDG